MDPEETAALQGIVHGMMFVSTLTAAGRYRLAVEIGEADPEMIVLVAAAVMVFWKDAALAASRGGAALNHERMDALIAAVEELLHDPHAKGAS